MNDRAVNLACSFVEFYYQDLGYWSEPMELLEGTTAGEEHEKTFNVPAIPTQVCVRVRVCVCLCDTRNMHVFTCQY